MKKSIFLCAALAAMVVSAATVTPRLVAPHLANASDGSQTQGPAMTRAL